MIKRDIVETVYEYDKEGKLLKKTVTETHEEENNTVTINPGWQYINDYCNTTGTTAKSSEVIHPILDGMNHPN